MKKVFAWMLVVMTLLLAACGNQPPVATPDTPTSVATPDEPEPTIPAATEPPTTMANDRFDPEASADIIGSWSTSIVLDGTMFNLREMEEKVEMTLIYRFNGDGTYSRGVDAQEYHAAIAAFSAAVEKDMLDRLYDKFIAEKILEDLSKKNANALWEESGKAEAQEQASRFVEGLYLDYRFSQINGEGDYYEENNILWLSKEDGTYERCGYSLSEEGLSIMEVENLKVYKQLGLELPLLLTKA